MHIYRRIHMRVETIQQAHKRRVVKSCPYAETYTIVASLYQAQDNIVHMLDMWT